MKDTKNNNSIEQFKELVIEKLNKVPEFNSKVETQIIIKNNGLKLEGIFIKQSGKLVSPTFYIEDLYDEYCNGADIDCIVNKVIDGFETRNIPADEICKFMSDFILVKEKVVFKIINFDDNQDLLDYLRMLLAPRYQITCALNGKEALDLLSELMPDLVISDVMMPVMDGMELCRKIKQNFRTSHLPVVLLTAKVETGDYVEGLENGADLYVAKPFSSDIIKAQIHSLLSNRERMKGSFKTEPMLPSASVASSRIDKEFLEKVTGIIESRMIDSDFSVDVLAQEIGISRTGLFTKLKAVSGMTPNDFIRIIRLKKAAVLLSQDGVQVSEACFQVGFSSPSYFAKCFQAQFGVAPTEFKRMKTVN